MLGVGNVEDAQYRQEQTFMPNFWVQADVEEAKMNGKSATYNIFRSQNLCPNNEEAGSGRVVLI